MITQTDIENLKTALKGTFVTKKEFEDRLESMENRINDKLTEMRLSLMNVFSQGMNEFLQELRAQRASWQHHEIRITKLGTTVRKAAL